jgi:hypothetical protein
MNGFPLTLYKLNQLSLPPQGKTHTFWPARTCHVKIFRYRLQPLRSNDMSQVESKSLFENCISVESGCNRGIPLMIELRESLDTVNLKLGAMSISTVRSLRHNSSKVRNGAQKVCAVSGMEEDICERISSEQSSRASSRASSRTSSDGESTKISVHSLLFTNNNVDSAMDHTTITMQHFPPSPPCNPPHVVDGVNSIILSMLKTNGKTRPAHPSTSIGLFDGSLRPFDSKCDCNVSPIKKSGHHTYFDKGLNEKPSQADAYNKSHKLVESPRKEWRKFSIMNKFVADESEVLSQHTDIESPDDGTLVDHSVWGATYVECDTSTRRSHIETEFSDLHISPSSTLESSEQSPDSDVFDGRNTINHALPAVKFDIDSIYAQKQAQFKHRRNTLTTSFMDDSTKISLPLRARSRTSDGILELKTGVSVTNTSKNLAHQHRRKMSMNLPIKVQPSQRFVFPSSVSAPFVVSETSISTSGPDEKELEYKHRHTFIGTASLEDFLELLELSPEHTTTKAKAAKAFVRLAMNEQLLARQSSANGTGWELVSRITPDVVSSHTDYLAQAHIKLGSVTLRQFLELIPFDQNVTTEAMNIVEAFCSASHMDGTAGSGAGLKAKAFRSWILRQQCR